MGSDEHSGISNPSFQPLAAAHGLRYEYIHNNAEIKDKTTAVLATEGPVLCELNLSYDQIRSPRVTSIRREDGTMESRPLEDMFPFLPKEEVWQNMHLFDEGDPPGAEKGTDAHERNAPQQARRGEN